LNPLVVAGHFGEGVDARLFVPEPLARSQFLTVHGLLFGNRFEIAHRAAAP
jgi:hypothetical protein